MGDVGKKQKQQQQQRNDYTICARTKNLMYTINV